MQKKLKFNLLKNGYIYNDKLIEQKLFFKKIFQKFKNKN